MIVRSGKCIDIIDTNDPQQFEFQHRLQNETEMGCGT